MDEHEMDGKTGHDEMAELKELVEFLKANEIAEFDLEKEGLKVRLKFHGAETHAAPPFDMAQMARLMASAPPAAGTPAAVPAGSAPVPPPATPEAAPAADRHVVKSPIVGTFYESPAPGSPPFVKVGDRVSVGQVLCIVEAMKLMNEIEADAAGEIVERIAKPGQPVEYGQPLFAIRGE